MDSILNSVSGLNKLTPLLAMVWFAIIVVVHVSFAVAVFSDASALASQRGSTTLGTPIIWALAALIVGVLGVMAYWFIHHSSLNPQKAESVNS